MRYEKTKIKKGKNPTLYRERVPKFGVESARKTQSVAAKMTTGKVKEEIVLRPYSKKEKANTQLNRFSSEDTNDGRLVASNGSGLKVPEKNAHGELIAILDHVGCRL
ncbi:MAG: hypothetical protein HOP37_07040 [Cyclobacteriaceae bacterium]|nr:hypothetical protein [Cyclobacteriaceae bacterium]